MGTHTMVGTPLPAGNFKHPDDFFAVHVSFQAFMQMVYQLIELYG